jgi:hypothetical protein
MLLLVFVFALLTQSVFSRALAPVIVQPRATVCNGHPELCTRTFGNVSFVGAHDSYAVGVDNLAANQDQSVTQQLNDGIRMLQVQAHDENGTIRLCHTNCSIYDGGTLQDYLGTVNTWLVANPNEVLSLLIVNIDNLGPTSFDSVFQSTGLTALSYTPPSASLPFTGWPTLGSMIDSGKRLVTFLDNGANFATIPYLLDEFTNIWESAFDVTDTSFNCSVDRTTGDASTEMYLINHFLDQLLFGQPVPNTSALTQTNAVSGTGSLGTQVDTCVAVQGRPPNFMLVDYYEFGGGSVFQVAATINGVTYSPTTPIATPASTSTFSSRPLGGASFLDHNQGYACVVSIMAVMIGMLFVV